MAESAFHQSGAQMSRVNLGVVVNGATGRMGYRQHLVRSLLAIQQDAGVVHGVVMDKLFLPGLRKLRRLVDGGFFGRICSVRIDFGYWVFEGDWQPAQRPSWNYRAEDGGGIVLDMFPHWHYVLENIFGNVRAVTAKAVTHIPERWDSDGAYPATADDAAYGIFELDSGIIAQINSSWAV